MTDSRPGSPLGSEFGSGYGTTGACKGVQTDNRPTSTSFSQTRRTQTSELSLADRGMPGQPIVDDDVVEYTDTNTAEGTCNTGESDVDDDDQVLAIGPSRLTVLLPQGSKPNTSKKVAGPSSVQSDLEVDGLHAQIKHLQAQLDDQRNATVLRERELHSIVDSCRSAFEQDFNARPSKIDGDRAQQAEGLHRTIRTLHEAIGKLEATVSEKDELISQHEKITADTVREKCRDWKLVEASLQMELGRMRGEREKTRFEAEVAEHRGRNHLIEAKTLAIRAHEAEVRWNERAVVDIVAAEDRERESAEALALASLSAIRDICVSCAGNVDFVVQKNKEQWTETLTTAARVLLPSVDEGERTALLDSAYSRDKLVYSGSKVFLRILDRVSLAQEAESERQKFYEQDTEQRLRSLQAEVAMWHETLDGVRKAADTRLEKLAMRCSSVEKVSQSLAEKSDVFSKKRADHKAHSTVLDDLVAEHSAETEAMSREIKLLRQENDLLRITNKITEADELLRKLQRSEAALKLSQQENGQLRIKVSTLESTCETMENGSRRHFATLESAQQELSTFRLRMDSREAAHEKEIEQLKIRDSLSREEIAELKRLSRLQDEVVKNQVAKIQSLEKSTETLREKYLQDIEGAAGRMRSSSGTASGADDGQESLEVVALRQKVLLMKRENDALTRKLDAALAEASHAEEHRLGTVNRCLSMMAAEDAAPRREQLIIGQQMQLQRDIKALEAREAELQLKQAALERKESAAKRALLPRSLSLRGDVTAPLPAERSATEVPSAAQEMGSGRQSSAGSNTSSSAYRVPVKLAPLTQRPPQQSEATVEHPQKLT